MHFDQKSRILISTALNLFEGVDGTVDDWHDKSDLILLVGSMQSVLTRRRCGSRSAETGVKTRNESN